MDIKGVEVFSTGVWNGNTITDQDLDTIVASFNETKNGIRPPLKLGHDDEQKFLQAEGLPAAGWIGNLYRSGSKLVADFVDIPSKIYELIQKRAYRKVSVEILHNLKIGDKTYKQLLGAIALLGADMPGVMNLADILKMYKIDAQEGAELKSYVIETGEIMQKTEREIELETLLQTEKDKAKALADAKDAAESKYSSTASELAKANKAKEDAEKAKAEADEKLATQEIQSYSMELEKEKLVTPAMRPLVEALFGPEKDEYTVKFKVKDKEEDKKYSKKALFKEILSLYSKAAKVNFEESSVDGDMHKADEDAKVAEMDRLIKEEKLTAKQAFKRVYKK